MSLDTNICGAYGSQFDTNFHNQLYEVDIHCWFLKTGVGTPHESVEWSNHGVKRISERVILWLTGQRAPCCRYSHAFIKMATLWISNVVSGTFNVYRIVVHHARI
jgi:hypothetical protein